ncbi:aldo/keto reductase [Nonomuraea sp. 10N515B]|uniref:aldo/keto reductase n=1 Tax=Nonomuraea sp. 10N515B TaxID=3457422 RepID=UPI003FCE26FD
MGGCQHRRHAKGRISICVPGAIWLAARTRETFNVRRRVRGCPVGKVVPPRDVAYSLLISYELSVEDSLTRMGVDRIDLLFLHDAEERFEAALRDGYPALAELRAEGMAGAIGAGMHDTGMLTRLVREADVDTVMLSHRAPGQMRDSTTGPPPRR